MQKIGNPTQQRLLAAAVIGLIGIGGAFAAAPLRADENVKSDAAIAAENSAETANRGETPRRGPRENRGDRGHFSEGREVSKREFREKLQKEFAARRDLIIAEQQETARQVLQSASESAAISEQLQTQFKNALIKFPRLGKEIFGVWKDAVAQSGGAQKTELLVQLQAQYIEYQEKINSRFHVRHEFGQRQPHRNFDRGDAPFGKFHGDRGHGKFQPRLGS